MLQTLTAVAALAMAVPSLSLAQTATPDQSVPAAQAATTDQYAPPAATSATSAGVNTSTGPIPADQLPPGQANALANGDNQLVTNGPVPDTPANRAKYGGPMSNAGRHTKPIGN
ncbi:MAG: hypothetical protein ACREEB_04125 [Caulobacteraceae bacterium]